MVKDKFFKHAPKPFDIILELCKCVGSTVKLPKCGGEPLLYQYIKRDRNNPDNYKGTSLLNIGYKFDVILTLHRR